MSDDLSTLFASLSTAAQTFLELKKLSRGKKGDSRAFLEEVKENLGLCWLVVERGTDPMRVIPEFSTSVYDRLLNAGFNFNSLQKDKIEGTPQLEASDLASLIDQKTEALIINLYDKIKTVKQIHKVDRDNTRIRWRRRINNIHRRMLLLVTHL